MEEKKTVNENVNEEINGSAPVNEGAVEAECVQPAQNQEDKPKKKRNPVKVAVAILLLAYAAFILIRQYVFVPGQYEAPPEATPAPTVEVEATPEPTPYVKRIPVKMYFTAREISFPVERVELVPYTDSKGNELKTEDGKPIYTMGTIDSEKVSAWLESGPAPGEYGNALFNGHISWKKVAGVFSILPKMEVGEEIVVEYEDGSTMAFKVTNVDIYNINDVPEDVMAFDTGDSRMTLITCYGESWNSGMGTRNERCVVVAKPANEADIVYPPAE